MPRFSYDSLMTFSVAMLRAAGAEEPVARTVASSLVGASLAGHDSHGLQLLPGYLRGVKEGTIKPNEKPVVEREGPSWAGVDGRWTFGQVVAVLCEELAIKKAQGTGLSIVTAHHSNHIGRLGQYSLMAAERGLIGVTMVNSGPATAPWGGAARRLGTNPICVAVPRGSGRPILLDMATSMVAAGKVILRANSGDPMPGDWMIDKNGNPSTRPTDYNEGGAMLPFGTYKGYGLGLVVDILAGVLSGTGGSNAVSSTYGHNGIFMLDINPETFVPRDQFERDTETLLRYVKETPLRAGATEILLPGDPEYRAEAARSREGIFIDDRTWGKVRETADSLGVTESIAPVSS